MVTDTPLDPVTLAVLRGRLEQIADEMDATLYRSAFNPIIAEAHDACHGLYDAKTGDTLIQGKSGLPVFVGAMAFAVRAAMRVAQSRGGMQPGDVWLFNDPYEGGTHANDFKLVRPCFRHGQLYCFLASAAHWHDVGGAVPGNYNPAATECWQEAVQIPPVRIVRGGQIDEDVLAILRANTRLPDSLWGDLNGQLAALELGAGRLDGLLDEYGDATVAAALQALRERAVKLMRSHIASLPDGRYSFDDVLDNDGVRDETLTIALDMTSRWQTAFNFGPEAGDIRSVMQLVQEAATVWPGGFVDASDPSAPHEAGRLALTIDKARAENGGWRIRESTLLLLALIGGTAGAIYAKVAILGIVIWFLQWKPTGLYWAMGLSFLVSQFLLRVPAEAEEAAVEILLAEEAEEPLNPEQFQSE